MTNENTVIESFQRKFTKKLMPGKTDGKLKESWVERIEDREGSIKKGQETISNIFTPREIINNFLSVNHECKGGGRPESLSSAIQAAWPFS